MQPVGRHLGIGPRDRISGAEVERIVDSWVRLDTGSQIARHWRFDLPATIELRGPASLFSVRGAPDVRHADEDTRADILAYDGAIHLLFYGKSHQLVYFPPDHDCFSPAVRRALGAGSP